MPRPHSRPIFIVGSPRSGTTILNLSLGAHPNISATLAESHIIASLVYLEKQCARWLGTLGIDHSYWSNSCATFFDNLKMEHARRLGKGRWCEKTPKYVFHLNFIRGMFPDVQVIHIVRDGRAVVGSHLRRWGWRRAAKATKLWGRSIQAARSFGKCYPDQYIELFYEDLVRNPKAELYELLKFLDEPWDDAVLSPYTYHEIPETALQARHRSIANRENSTGIHRQGLQSGARLNILLKILLYRNSGNVMRQLGYI